MGRSIDERRLLQAELTAWVAAGEMAGRPALTGPSVCRTSNR